MLLICSSYHFAYFHAVSTRIPGEFIEMSGNGVQGIGICGTKHIKLAQFNTITISIFT